MPVAGLPSYMSAASVHTSSTVGGGKPFLPPETWADPTTASELSDVYMFGGVLHEIMTGACM